MMFSLARGGYAPAAFGRVSARGAPVPALLVSAAGLALALLVSVWFPEGAFVYLFGISLFGGLYAWLIIFVSHLAFRPKWQAAGGAPLPVKMCLHPLGSLFGAASMLAILATTWWVEGMRVTLIAGVPWLGVLTVGYLLVARRGTVPQNEIDPPVSLL